MYESKKQNTMFTQGTGASQKISTTAIDVIANVTIAITKHKVCKGIAAAAFALSVGTATVMPTVVAAQDNQQVLQRLTNFTDSLTSFSAGFTQVVYDANSNPLQQSAGEVFLKRPGRFIWNYTSPSPQKIVADGNSVWLYDIDLEQVTVSPLAEQGSGTPLSLLMGDKPLDQEFTLRPLGNSDGIDWVELKPRSGHSDFELVFLGLNEAGLAAMELRDSFGQATQIRFTDFKADVRLDDAAFQFVPPEGVDVIGEG